MSTKIAIATEDGVHVSAHFGRAPYFQVLTIDSGQIVAREKRDKAQWHRKLRVHERAALAQGADDIPHQPPSHRI